MLCLENDDGTVRSWFICSMRTVWLEILYLQYDNGTVKSHAIFYRRQLLPAVLFRQYRIIQVCGVAFILYQ